MIDCADCGGYDLEWMYQCHKHLGVWFCRGCECPFCADEDDVYDFSFQEDDEQNH